MNEFKEHYVPLIGHNPYFNRWFSAIRDSDGLKNGQKRHNPYFNRWFSAIFKYFNGKNTDKLSQSLF